MTDTTPHSTEPTRADRPSSLDRDEVARFDALAQTWWDPNGPMKPLHRLNPTRLQYLRQRINQHFARRPDDLRPLAGLTVADIGCGGGLVAEPLARLGASVTGIDAAPRNIEVASRHAEAQGLTIDYRETTAEDLVRSGARFDMVTALEIVEHVADPASFVKSLGQLVKPGGLLIMSTLNRTSKAFLMAIVGAEYVMRWLPRGTHDWRKFLRPSELAELIRDAGLVPHHQTGLVYNPLAGAWSLSERDLDVNYMVSAHRPD
ncbi:MAG: bifunctional 2-polyprenyl-6-hydroxyphenol methylase/3-demethylubiquinol 3-O-methyltransferase UbiG [Alphaproteobacteria bacterium]|nr:MAG: bifunctional 2-polyprenyl-6-hydroxyphenol methylase/3-demethylubiquinol 3-O-methyltransferase UbiG [Alphaproteobacteria bacterium]